MHRDLGPQKRCFEKPCIGIREGKHGATRGELQRDSEANLRWPIFQPWEGEVRDISAQLSEKSRIFRNPASGGPGEGKVEGFMIMIMCYC